MITKPGGPSDETALYQKHIKRDFGKMKKACKLYVLKRDFGKVKKACKLYRGIFISINWQI